MLPLMKSRNSKKRYEITAFGGLNPSYSRKVNELKSSLNMSSDKYPALCSASPHIKNLTPSYTVRGAVYNGDIYTIERASSGNMYVGKNCGGYVKIPTTKSSESARCAVSCDNQMIIIPDNCVYNYDTKTCKNAEVVENITKQHAEERFAELSSDTMTMPYNIWYSSYLSHNSITAMKSTYRVSSTSYDFYHMNIVGDFKPGDIVTIKMAVKPIDVTRDAAYYQYVEKMQNGVILKIKSITKTTHAHPGVTSYTNNQIVFDDGAVDMGGYSTVYVTDITIEKKLPDLVDICSMDNRVWGITQKEIRCSNLGDPTQWYDFSVDDYGTLPSSSFCTRVETNGDFVAIASLDGNIYAFKENYVHKVYGKEPAEFTVATLSIPGMNKNSPNSLARIGNCLYYHGQNGIYRFSDGRASLISHNLDVSGMTSSIAGADERYYYIELHNSQNSYLYVFDTFFGIWHITTGISNVVDIINTIGGIKFICNRGIYSYDKAKGTSWTFTYSFGAKEFSSKHLCNVSFRYTQSADSTMSVVYKSRFKEKELYSYNNAEEKENIVTLNIPPYCSEDCELVFTGTGRVIFPSIHVTYKETGIS